jgi:hypothetical protein
MAQDQQNTSGGEARSFDKALNEDINDFHLGTNSWTQARNAINNSISGDLGKLGNEPANYECIRLTNTSAVIIGFIHVIEDKWVVFSVDPANISEIGIFDESTCQYDTVVTSTCLNFNVDNLIKGVSKSLSTCTYNVYWDDGINPSRILELDVYDVAKNLYTDSNSTIPWIQIDTTPSGPCHTFVNTSNLDCDKTRLALFIDPICPRVEKGFSGGNLYNGSYMVAMAYAINGQKISDWYVSNAQGLFDHNNSSSSLDVFIDSIDHRFSQVIVATIATINQQTVVRQAGIYSTRQTRLSFDVIFDTWPTIPIEQLPIMTPITDKTDAMYNVGDYLIRTGPTTKFDFNYQPLANQIVAKWQSIKYPADYYHKGGNHVGYMRDEVYPFFIEWIYDTGDTSASYHIPGRPAIGNDKNPVPPGIGNDIYNDDDEYWKVYNTATVSTTFPLPPAVGSITLPDGGVVIEEGYMGYWESSELYPDNKPEIWNPNIDPINQPWTAVVSTPYPTTQISDYDLCGKHIRHHRFPEDGVSINTPLFENGGANIRVMGVAFDNIKAPRDNGGNPIPGIIGYRILRGTRNGNKTVIAKGIINNMRDYAIPGSNKRGLMPNYPYNDLRDDDYLTSHKTITDPITGFITGAVTMPGGFGGYGSNQFSDAHYTFHSPDTNFNNPYLAAKEFRIYGAVYGDTLGKFDYSEKHPKEKLVTNLSFIIAAIGGIGIALVAANGKRQTPYKNPTPNGLSFSGVTAATGGTFDSPSIPDVFAIGIGDGIKTIADQFKPFVDYGILFNTLAGNSVNDGYGAIQGAINDGYTGNAITKTEQVNQESGYLDYLPFGFKNFSAIPLFLNYFSDGTDSILRLIKAILRYRDFAVRYHSHGFYDSFEPRKTSYVAHDFRKEILTQNYLRPEILNINTNYQINNLFRQRTVHFETAPSTFGKPFDLNNLNLNLIDTSRFTGHDLGVSTIEDLVNTEYSAKCSSFYGALKVRIRNQYGQLNNIVQLPTSPCYTKVTIDVNGQFVDANNVSVPTSSTGSLFGGDVYINRYTEKNTFFFFYDWLEGQPDGAQFDYGSHVMVPYPHYWANFNDFQTSDFTTSFWSFFSSLPSFSLPSLTSPPSFPSPPSPPGLAGLTLPSSYYALDGQVVNQSNIASFVASTFRFDKRGWFYLFNSGVRDFFVESEINVGYRDYGETEDQKFYDPYGGGDTKTLFNTAIIKSGNYYKYDISLSVTKLFSNYTSWATMQSPSYNPYIAETCYVYRSFRVIYSLPSQYEGIKDGWRVFLTNNYYDFDNTPTCIKSINKSGAIIFFDAASPVQFQGTDQLETGLGTKLTIGDGGLFSQPLQALINVESSHEYGSCQNRMSVINTPAGVYWISQNQGKIFTVAGQGLKEVSNVNMKWWFAQFLPYNIVESYPDFELLDNPVTGVACQSVYNNQDGLVYFCKKDYKLRADAPDIPVYLGSNKFLVNNFLVIELGNPNDTVWPVYFEDASWTISYDPKTDGWVGYHDWHPTFTLPGKNTFMTVDPTSRNSIWVHNVRCDLYCNYYGIDYPFEVEFTVNTVQEVNTLRSIQYQLECYKYAPNCYDRFHELDFNFDEATIYNTEQTSGLLKLVLNPKQDPTAILRYPIINPTNINVLFSKEENKYRFNQFWDVTDDRGEYFNSLIPGFAQRTIWNTGANGYVRVLNSYNLNYNKGPFQRKKFRHYTVSVLLRRLVSGNTKMLVMLADTKTLLSPR